jgi:hypothetical protein
MVHGIERAGIETPAEAYAALAALMVGADGLATMEEGRFLWERARVLPVFAGLDEAGFSHLVRDVTDRVWSTPPVLAGVFDDEALTGLIGGIRDALPEDLRVDALRMVSDLAWVDGYNFPEHALLERLRAGLGPNGA